MAKFRTAWLLKNQIILHQVMGEFSPKTMHETVAALNEYLGEAVMPPYLVIDAREITSYQPNIQVAIDALKSNEHSSKVEWVILISSNPAMRFVGQLVKKVMGNNIQVVASLEEAVSVLVGIDPSLNQLRKLDLSGFAKPETSD